MLKNAPTLAIGGVDTEENEHCKVCPLSVYRSPRSKTLRILPSGMDPELALNLQAFFDDDED